MNTKKTKEKINIIIADDHTFFREGLAKVLKMCKHYVVLGEAANGEELVLLASQHAPDLLIVDIGMPTLNGIEAVKQIKHLGINCKVIALSMHSEAAILNKMIDAGAMSILDKNISRDELYEAINTVVLENCTYFPAATKAKMQNLLNKAPGNDRQKNVASFSDREIEIINLVCKDYSNKMIAEKLALSSRTVEAHRTRIMEKMEVKSVAGLVAYAFSHGISVIEQ